MKNFQMGRVLGTAKKIYSFEELENMHNRHNGSSNDKTIHSPLKCQIVHQEASPTSYNNDKGQVLKLYNWSDLSAIPLSASSLRELSLPEFEDNRSSFRKILNSAPYHILLKGFLKNLFHLLKKNLILLMPGKRMPKHNAKKLETCECPNCFLNNMTLINK